MSQRDKKTILEDFTARFLETLNQKAPSGSRSYGFEYEFISRTPLSLDNMDKIYRFMSSCGFVEGEGSFLSPSGVYVTFEPGGQIEYHSMPMFGWDKRAFRDVLSEVRNTNEAIRKTLGIEYLSVGFIPDRGDAPLCLTSERYQNLHARMKMAGTRGLEMMKGTASIHLHVVIRNPQEMMPLFRKVCELSASEEYRASWDRRDIWNNADPTRCGQDICNHKHLQSSEHLVGEMVRFALDAVDLWEGVPFRKGKEITFNKFLYHMTTIFTNVRINCKGPTVEMRTLDSLPAPQFEEKWKRFISIMEEV
jgi:gamma-glutamylcysteine synthetase